MKNILMSYFDTVLTLDAFFIEINLKLNEHDTEKLKLILKKLNSIIIAFDFEFKGPFKSIIDKRYSYEQMLYLCSVKINESVLSVHQNHFLKFSQTYSNSNSNLNLSKNLNQIINLQQTEIEKKLLSTDNLTICYFLNKSLSNDGIYWRQLYDLIGFSIMKYIILYSYIFRRVNNLNSSNIYVQVCGTKFNFIYKNLVSKNLKLDEKNLKEKLTASKNQVKKSNNLAKDQNKSTTDNLANFKQIQESKKLKSTNLKEIFAKQDEIQYEELKNQKSILFQLNRLGNQNLNKTSILYDRNLGNKISPKMIYSDKNLEINSINVRKIINHFIFKFVSFDELKNKQKLDEMIQMLETTLAKFLNLHRSCPFKIFLDCYCKKDQITKEEKTLKRKRSNLDNENKNESCLSSNISSKSVYCFLRRCLMYTLEYDDKIKQKFDTTCTLIGGKENFKCLLKQLRVITSGLKYDSFKLNSLLHGIKISRITYLKPLEDERSKQLILICIIRWLFEDYIFKIIKAYFYVTDTSKTNSEIFFYLKSDWKLILKNQLSDQHKKNYRKIYNLEKIKEVDLMGYCSRYESFGAHLGRLLPKNVNNECRIISGCKAFNPCTTKTFNINYRFITLNNCLKWIINKDPDLIGFACRGQVELHKRYSKFLKLNYLNRLSTCEENDQTTFKHWNFIKFDINKCFDSIDSKDLCQYIMQIFHKEIGYDSCFTLFKYASFHIDIDYRHLKPRYDYLTIKHNLYMKAFSNGMSDFINILENNQREKFTDFKFKSTKNDSGSIYVPLTIHDKNINLRKLNETIKKCLNHVIIKIHDELYERVNGILQGGVCSRNLCDLYLGRIEKRLFYYQEESNQSAISTSDQMPMILNKANEIIMRIVDDYLVISSNLDRLFKIKDLLKKELNLNETKTVFYEWNQSNNKIDFIKKNSILNLNHYKNLSNNLMEIDENLKCEMNFLSNFSNSYFSWCGFNIDVKTLDIYFNYEKYFDDSNSLNNRLNSNIDYKFAYVAFNNKFLRLFSSNVSILVIDPDSNSFQAILRNFVDFFALSAIRFCVLNRLMPSQMNNNAKLQVKIILNLCYLSNNRISYKLKNVLQKYFYSSFSLFKFLCLRVYLLIFLKFEQPKYAHLIKLINVNLKKLNFIRCIKYNCDFYFLQLIELIDQQSIKFYNCKF